MGGDRQSTWEHMAPNKQQAMCSTHRDIWWPAWAHQQDHDTYSPRGEPNGFRRPVRSLLVMDDVTYCNACECSSNFYTGSRCKSQVSCKVFHSQQNYYKVTALNSKTTISPGINDQLMLAEATYICMNETQHDIHYPPTYGSQSFLNPFNLRWYTRC